MPETPLRTLSIFEKGSTYTIFDSDSKVQLFTIHFNNRSAPQMTVIRGSNTNSVIGSATYYAIKKFGIPITTKITLRLPSTGNVYLDKEGGFFGNGKRSMRSAVMGHVYWSSRQVNNPWKGGRAETSYMKLVNASGKTLVEYKDEGHTLKRMGVLKIAVELPEGGMDEVVASGMAMLSQEQTGVKPL